MQMWECKPMTTKGQAIVIHELRLPNLEDIPPNYFPISTCKCHSYSPYITSDFLVVIKLFSI